MFITIHDNTNEKIGILIYEGFGNFKFINLKFKTNTKFCVNDNNAVAMIDNFFNNHYEPSKTRKHTEYNFQIRHDDDEKTSRLQFFNVIFNKRPSANENTLSLCFRQLSKSNTNGKYCESTDLLGLNVLDNQHCYKHICFKGVVSQIDD